LTYLGILYLSMNKIKTLALQLSEVALQKNELTLKEETIKSLLLAEMAKEGTAKESYDFGTISVGARKTYKYSDAVTKLEEKIKIKKDDEVKQGIAETKVTEFITFRGVTIK